MNIGVDELKYFCDPGAMRSMLHEPFTYGEFTYATNGFALLKVPKVAGVPEGDERWKAALEVLFKNFNTEGAIGFKVELPKPESKECQDCCGSGKAEHDCECCECDCESCDGSGRIHKKFYIDVNGAAFDTKALRLVYCLPNLKIKTSPDSPNWFTFDGGEGCLMPCRSVKEFTTIAEIL